MQHPCWATAALFTLSWAPGEKSDLPGLIAKLCLAARFQEMEISRLAGAGLGSSLAWKQVLQELQQAGSVTNRRHDDGKGFCFY